MKKSDTGTLPRHCSMPVWPGSWPLMRMPACSIVQETSGARDRRGEGLRLPCFLCSQSARRRLPAGACRAWLRYCALQTEPLYAASARRVRPTACGGLSGGDRHDCGLEGTVLDDMSIRDNHLSACHTVPVSITPLPLCSCTRLERTCSRWLPWHRSSVVTRLT